MIINKDQELKDHFYRILRRLDIISPDGTIYISRYAFGGVRFNKSNEYTHHMIVDEEGKVFISDRDIDKIAKRLLDLLKKEGMI
jgi:hypothetical protein